MANERTGQRDLSVRDGISDALIAGMICPTARGILFPVVLMVSVTCCVPAYSFWGPGACMRGLAALLFGVRPIPGPHRESEIRQLEAGTPAQREYAAQLRRLGQIWSELREPLNGELAQFERMGRSQRAAYLEEVSQRILGRLREKWGVQNIGVHFNMHGGQPVDYVNNGGIRAGTPTLPGANHRDLVDMNRERVSEVYFFQTDRQSLHEILATPHQDNVLFPFFRMGSGIVLFNLDGLLGNGVNSGLVIRHGLQFIRFDPARVPENSIGVPSSMFLAPPIPVFYDIPARLGRYDLSWDGETLSALRMLERLLL